jgi:hypothetical protein
MIELLVTLAFNALEWYLTLSKRVKRWMGY